MRIGRVTEDVSGREENGGGGDGKERKMAGYGEGRGGRKGGKGSRNGVKEGKEGEGWGDD